MTHCPVCGRRVGTRDRIAGVLSPDPGGIAHSACGSRILIRSPLPSWIPLLFIFMGITIAQLIRIMVHPHTGIAVAAFLLVYGGICSLLYLRGLRASPPSEQA